MVILQYCGRVVDKKKKKTNYNVNAVLFLRCRDVYFSRVSGEASHGTHEFYSVRAKITKRLIMEVRLYSLRLITGNRFVQSSKHAAYRFLLSLYCQSLCVPLSAEGLHGNCPRERLPRCVRADEGHARSRLVNRRVVPNRLPPVPTVHVG